MACTCTTYPQNNNTETFIPVKIGEPLSTACERTVREGSIPEVFNYAGITLVDGQLPTYQVSSGGIANMALFFKQRVGCFNDLSATNIGTTCA